MTPDPFNPNAAPPIRGYRIPPATGIADWPDHPLHHIYAQTAGAIPVYDAVAPVATAPVPWPWLVRAAAWLCRVKLPERLGGN